MKLGTLKLGGFIIISNILPGINPEFISDEEEENEDEYLKDDEICENILAGKQPPKRTKPNSVAVKQQLTMEAFANLAPRSKLAESRKIRTLDDDPRKQAPKSKEPPIGKKTTTVQQSHLSFHKASYSVNVAGNQSQKKKKQSKIISPARNTAITKQFSKRQVRSVSKFWTP